jgi:hypothetical protein
MKTPIGTYKKKVGDCEYNFDYYDIVEIKDGKFRILVREENTDDDYKWIDGHEVDSYPLNLENINRRIESLEETSIRIIEGMEKIEGVLKEMGINLTSAEKRK